MLLVHGAYVLEMPRLTVRPVHSMRSHNCRGSGGCETAPATAHEITRTQANCAAVSGMSTEVLGSRDESPSEGMSAMKRSRYLVIERCHSLSEIVAAMQSSDACSLCREKFAANADGLCVECADHVFGDHEDCAA